MKIKTILKNSIIELLSFFLKDELKKFYLKESIVRIAYTIYARIRGAKIICSSKVTKKSDTVFILGSGESLSHITDDMWNHISNHDVFGVNMSIVHDYPVNFQFWEMLGTESIDRIFLDRINQEQFRNTKIVINLNHALNKGFFASKDVKILKNNNVFGYAPLNLSLGKPTKENFSNYYEFIRSDKKSKHTVRHCTHIGAAVDYAFLCGYKKIVLIGCDLNGGKYFTEVESKSDKYKVNDYYSKCNVARNEHALTTQEFFGKLHPTMQKELMEKKGTIDAFSYFKVVQGFYSNHGTRLYVMNESSLLSEFINIYTD